MKKITLAYFTIVFAISSCFHTSNDVSIKFSETNKKYEMKAAYQSYKTKAVQHYIQSQLSPTIIFKQTDTDVDVTTVLEDDTKLYIQSNEGNLKIKLNKEKNSEASYYRIKKMCEGIKDIINH